jgi:hypothetical protein
MIYLALLLFVATAALVLFALFQWRRDRRQVTPPRFEPSPDLRQFGKAYTPDTRIGHAAERGTQEFRPLADMPAAPPLPAVPALNHDAQRNENQKSVSRTGSNF